MVDLILYEEALNEGLIFPVDSVEGQFTRNIVNQVGGLSCIRMESIGLFVPCKVDERVQGAAFNLGYRDLRIADIERIDRAFAHIGSPWRMSQRRQDSYEAWLQVWIPGTRVAAIMVWENSD